MTLHLGKVPANSVLYIPFASYNSAGASITLTGLAVTDIEIYKNGAVAQRASDAGYALLDTDGIDFDGLTGIHGFSIDLADNTDAGFYAVGSQYWVVVSAVTVDGQTVNFIAATFRIGPAESSAGVDKVDVSHFGGTAGTFASGRPEVNTTHWGGTVVASANVLIDNAITAAKIATDAITAAKIATGALTAAKFAAGAFDAVWSVASRLLTAGTNIVLAKGTGITGFNDLDAAGVRGAVGLATANLDTQLAALPTAGENADAVWDEPIAGHVAAGSTGEALTAAGSAGDPWVTALPGAYGAGSAGFIVGTNLNATVSSRATQATADAIEADTQNIQTRLPAALVSGRIDSSVGAMAANVLTATAIATGAFTAAKFAAGAFDAVWTVATRLLTAGTNIVLAKGIGVTGFNDLDAAGVRSAVGLASANLDTQLGDLPTNAELAASQAAADDATLAAIAALNNPSLAAIADAVWDEAMAGHIASGSAGEFQANTPTTAQIVSGILAGEITELPSVPGASPQLEEAIAFLYMAVRNARHTTASADEIHNSGGTVIGTAVVSDDGTTFVKGKYA